MLAGCSGNEGHVETPPPTILEQETAKNLLDEFATAMRDEDIDRVDALLSKTVDVSPQRAALAHPQLSCQNMVSKEPELFRELISESFRKFTMTDFDSEAINISVNGLEVSFLEIQTAIVPDQFEQRTRVFRTTFLLRKDRSGETFTKHIALVCREGESFTTPLFEVATLGQMVAGTPTQVQVRGAALREDSEVRIQISESGTDTWQTLKKVRDQFQDIFMAPMHPAPPPMRVRIDIDAASHVSFNHRYHLRVPGEGFVQRIDGTGRTRFFAVAISPEDGTVWAGGQEPIEDVVGGGGALYKVLPEMRDMAMFHDDLLNDPAGRVLDLAFDNDNRLHAVVFASRANGTMIILDGEPFKCPAVDMFDQNQGYPLFVSRDPSNPDDPDRVPSPITRAVQAAEGGLWLFGADGGVAQVTTSFKSPDHSLDVNCPNIRVTYEALLRREAEEKGNKLLSNTVPALVDGQNGTLWIGTALGLMQRQDKDTPAQVIPFQARINLTSKGLATLEAYFQALSRALFDARPLRSVRLGGDIFDLALIKQDLIFSVVADGERIWAGTLGGGLRRIETCGGEPRDTLHLTKTTIEHKPCGSETTRVPEVGARSDHIFLGSNNILSLAMGPDRSVWAATDEGISRIQEIDGEVAITNFTALDGLKIPVWDVAVETTDKVWLATEDGLFRFSLQAGEIVTGVVVDAAGQPVVGAVVVLEGTSFRAITDEHGRYTLLNLPPGYYRLRFESDSANGLQDIAIVAGEKRADVNLPGGKNMVEVKGSGVVTVGKDIKRPLKVRIMGAPGAEVQGVPVRFTLIEKPQPSRRQVEHRFQVASLPAQKTIMTDRNGEAEIPLTAGQVAGKSIVLATADEQNSVTFTVDGQADEESASIEIVSGDYQFAIRGEKLRDPFVVQILDEFANPIQEELKVAIISGVGRLSRGMSSASQCSDQRDQSQLTTIETNSQGLASFHLEVCETRNTEIKVSETVGREKTSKVLMTAALANPTRLATEMDGSLVAIDSTVRAVLRLSPNGNRTVVSGQGRGEGEEFMEPYGIVVDRETGNMFVSDMKLQAVIQVDPETGDRKKVTCNHVLLDSPGDVAIDANLLFVVDKDLRDVRRDVRNIVKIELKEQGDCTELQLSEALENPVGIAIGNMDGTLFVAESAKGRTAVLEIDPDNGTSRIVSGHHVDEDIQTGSGPPFVTLADIITHDDTIVVVDSGLPAIVEVDRTTGDRTVISGPDMGRGPLLKKPVAITIVEDEQTSETVFVVADLGLRTALRIDSNGDRTIVSDIGSTSFLQDPRNLAVYDDRTLLVVDKMRKAVVSMDSEAGNPTITYQFDDASDLRDLVGIAAMGNSVFLIDQKKPAVIKIEITEGEAPKIIDLLSADTARESGLELKSPVDIVVDEEGLVLLDQSRQSIVRIEASGHLKMVSGSGDGGKGRGPSFALPQGIAVEASGDFVVVDWALQAVVRVNSGTGDRELVSGMDRGTGPELKKPVDIAVARSDHSLVVVDEELQAVLRIDVDGNRTILSDKASPGLAIERPIAIDEVSDGSLRVVDARLAAVLRVDPNTGRRALISK